MSPSPILAITMAIGLILLGNWMEGGHIDSLIQPTAGMIVLGGTIGATWLASTDEEIKNLFRLMPRILKPGLADRKALLETLLKVASVARRDGVLAVEAMLPEIHDEFLSRGLRVLIDGYSVDDLRKLLEIDMDITEHHGNASSKVFETAGGYAPTVGILGAVLGLIHVMSNLDDPSKLGTGIAVAFVATIYGVGSANLVFLPLGSRLKKIIAAEVEVKTMVLTGLEVVASGANPRQLEEMLTPYVGHGKGGDHGGGDAAKEAA
ncbi:MAG: flagellar motor protein [Myxococcota bacterium]